MGLFDTLVADWGWILILSLIFIVAVAVHFLLWLLCKRYLPRLTLKKHTLSAALITSAAGPIKFFIWVFALSLCGWVLARQFKVDELALIAVGIIHIAGIISLLWFFISFSKEAEEAILIRRHLDPTSFRMLIRLLRLGLVVVAVLLILPIFNVNVGGILAVGGFGGLVIGLAAKDSLGNLFGGIVLSFDKPFSIGDDIHIPEKGFIGTVEHVGWRAVRIRTNEKKVLYVPNSLFSTLSVENFTRMTNRRIREVISLRYMDIPKLEAIADEIEEQLKGMEELDMNRLTYAKLTKFADSAVEITVCAYTLTRDLKESLRIRQMIFLKCASIIKKHGADFAFPTSTLFMPDLAGKFSPSKE